MNNCEVCESNQFKYSCPRCSMKYCSVDCYKNHNEKNCSESFYKELVQEHLFLENDQQKDIKIQQMNEILQKYSLNEDVEDPVEELDEPLEELDSDDNEDDEPDLSERISNINLNDTESLWNALNEQEKQEFKCFVAGENVEELLEPIEPYWSKNTKIQSLEESKSLKKKFDRIQSHIKNFNEITSKNPSPAVLYNLHNVIASYTFVHRFFNSDVEDYFKEAASVFLTICSNLSRNVIFESEISAIQSVVHECNANNYHVDQDVIEMDVKKVFEGQENPIFYLVLILGDIKNLLKICLSNSKINAGREDGNSESSFFKDFNTIACGEIDREKYKNYVKKIDYYLSFVKFKLSDFNKNLLN